MIPYGRQDIDAADIEAVVEVLRSDFLTQGPMVPAFEAAIAAHCGAAHAVAVNSATSALHIACLALGLGPGDRLWTVPNTFVASANCALYCGAAVDFVDIDPTTWNMSPAALADKLEVAEKVGALPKIVVPVHFGGQPCDMAAIAALAKRYGFRIIEDASHALGATLDGVPVGGTGTADIVVLSFHPVKILTSGEGGMALTQDPGLAEAMRLLRSHGVTRDPARLQQQGRPGYHYEQHMLGFNYRMTDIHAALGLSQTRRLDAFILARQALAKRYDDLLRNLPLRLPVVAPGRLSAWHLYVVRIEAAAAPRDRVYEAMRAAGIGVNLHYAPVHLQPYYRELGFRPGLCPVAERYGTDALTLPLHATLTFTQQDTVVAALGALVGTEGPAAGRSPTTSDQAT